MSQPPEVAAGPEGLRFSGAVGASLSHEINNVLAIINELSGLMDDFLAAAESGRPLDPDRLKNSVERISRQVDRGKGYVKLLNQFSHAVDEARVSLDAREAFGQMVAICTRFYTLKKVGLENALPDDAVVLEGCPFDLRHLVYRCLDAALQASAAGQTVDIRLEAAADGARIMAAGREPCQPDPEAQSRFDLLSGLAGRLGGEARIQARPGQPLEIAVILPQRLESLAFEEE